jgi:hypothetical protein
MVDEAARPDWRILDAVVSVLPVGGIAVWAATAGVLAQA